MSEIYAAYGMWNVTTEGDCEGRTTSNLGTFEGYLDDIAFSLGRKAYYALRFEPAKPLVIPKQDPPVNQVSVSLGIESGTWPISGHTGMSEEQRVEYFKNMLVGRKTTVKPGTFYASVLLVKDTEIQKRNLREQALKKLTQEEKEALGIE